jgi:DNA-binding transcriptional ArsR family regulator
MPRFSDDATLDAAVDALRFLGDRNRLRILRTLARAELCVLDLIEELRLPQPLVSYHLRKLREAGLVTTRRRAQWIFYSLDQRGWEALVAPLSALTAPLALPPEAVPGGNDRAQPVAASAAADD